MKLSVFQTLIDEGLIDDKQLEECQAVVKQSGEPLDRVLRSKGFVSEGDLLQVLGRMLRFDFKEDLETVEVPKEFTQKVPAQFARNYNLIGLARSNGSFEVATCDPLDIHPMDELSSMLSATINPVLSPRSSITSLINKAYQRTSADVEELLDGIEDDDMISLTRIVDESEDVLDIANKPPIIKLMNTILFEALKIRASDIHLQPYADRLQVRYRIDGILYEAKIIPKKFQDAIISRVKVMGKMDIAERRLPQDGRTTIKVGDGEVDVRISTVPTSSGERVVFRLLDKSARLYQLHEIGLNDKNQEIMHRLIAYSHGIILITGPTGSGKTTTLYASLLHLNDASKKILTVEDPIEYQLEGINQIQVKPGIGLGFPNVLRSMLRHDPDIILIGEIRDVETAEIAIQAALTGHLVLSTLHTNNAASAVTRLLDMGVEDYLLTSTLSGVAAQRLVRTLCRHCREEHPALPEIVKQLHLDRYAAGSDVRLYRAKGCDACGGSGYFGRTSITETFVITDPIRQLILRRTESSALYRAAVEAGMQTMFDDGIKKAMDGETTVEEVLRVTRDF